MIAGMGLQGANPIGEATIAALFGGMASAASGGDFAEGALTAMVVYLYNEAWSDMMAEKAAFGRVRKGSLLKNAAKGGKDLAEGVVSAPKALYAYGDYLGRSTGFRDWQHGNRIGWYKMEAKAEYKLLMYGLKYHKMDILEKLGNDVLKRPNYYIGAYLTGKGIGFIDNILGGLYTSTSLSIKPAGTAADIIHNEINPLH